MVVVIAGLLLLPLVAMQFTDAVKWDGTDFMVMGALLLGVGLLCELILRKVTKTNKRISLLLIVLVLFLLVWAELAVGIFGTPFAGN